MKQRLSLSILSIGGIIAPTVFIAGWALLGLTRSGYSPVSQAISELARLGQPTHTAMTSVFVAYAVFIAMYSVPLARFLGTEVGVAAFISGLGTFGVACAPLGTELTDRLHLIFAAISYVAVAAGPLLGARRLNGAYAKTAALLGLLVAATLLFHIAGPKDTSGLFQRTGLTLGDLWFLATAVGLISKGKLAENVFTPGPAQPKS